MGKIMFNGIYKDIYSNNQFCNAHLFYKGLSIIIDYEWCLHNYDENDKIDKKTEDLVPFEVYSHNGGIYVGYVHINNAFDKADMAELISTLDDIIENKDKYITI